MKTFTELLTEIYEPVSGPGSPEAKFIQKHMNNTEFFIKDGKDYAGNSVDGPPYKGIVNTYKRPPMHGYDPGQDTKAYD